jgi:23S rRNA (cytidine1920-2'-O)/16S rRNA (cytidine1409-2'-O)-methyltransferase
VRNPRSLVRAEARVEVVEAHPLRGEVKLDAALEAFAVAVAGRVALDVGAAAGGFTRALLAAGARRVYAVDAGHGQLLGSLRQDDRVVTLERTNLGDLDRGLVPEPVEVITIDVSYLALARAVPQLDRAEIAPGADLVALVKPMFELGLARPPTDEARLREALRRAEAGIEAAGWTVRASIESPIRGGKGAVEFFVHARKE